MQVDHTEVVGKLEFSPRGDRCATASSDATSMVIEYPSGRIVGPAFAGAGGINAVAFTPDGSLLVGGGSDGAVHLWDLDRGRLVASTSSGPSTPQPTLEQTHAGRTPDNWRVRHECTINSKAM